MKGIKELLMKRAQEGKFLDEKSIEAKKSVLSEIEKMMSGQMGDKLKGLKRVTVASDTAEGLKAGLEKAEDIIEEKEDEEGSESNEDKIKALKAKLENLQS